MGFKIERLQQVIKFKVSQLILRDLQDPRIGLITITYVKLAKDLSTCVIGYSILGGAGDRTKCEFALNDARGWIQREVARSLHTRKAPQLTFRFDESIEGSARIAEMLRTELGEEIIPLEGEKGFHVVAAFDEVDEDGEDSDEAEDGPDAEDDQDEDENRS